MTNQETNKNQPEYTDFIGGREIKFSRYRKNQSIMETFPDIICKTFMYTVF